MYFVFSTKSYHRIESYTIQNFQALDTTTYTSANSFCAQYVIESAPLIDDDEMTDMEIPSAGSLTVVQERAGFWLFWVTRLIQEN